MLHAASAILWPVSRLAVRPIPVHGALSLWQATVKGLKLSGKWRELPKERQTRDDEARMRHHHYHCERNPEGFLRLKLENFEREERERIRTEAMALKTAGER